MYRFASIISILCMLIVPDHAVADRGPIENDNQYANPEVDETLRQAAKLDPDGRMPIQVRGAFGKGLQFRPYDDAFSVELRARAQLLMLTHFDLAANTGDFDALVRRFRIVLGGHVLQQRITYYFQIGFSRNDLEEDRPVPLRDAFITWHAHRDLNIRFGQMKVPFDRQRVTSSSALQMVDRSRITQELNLDRDVGFQIYSNDFLGFDTLSYQLGLFQGEGRNRIRGEFGLLGVMRVQISPLGSFADLEESDLRFYSKPKVAVAAAAAYNHNTLRAQSTLGTPLEDEELDYVHGMADAIFKWRGFSMLAQGIMRRLLDRQAADGFVLPTQSAARSAIGGFLQTGLLLSPHWELSLRAGHLEPLNTDEESNVQRLTEMGAGLSWYVLKHNLKFQLDNFVYIVGAQQDVVNETRLQSQIYF